MFPSRQFHNSFNQSFMATNLVELMVANSQIFRELFLFHSTSPITLSTGISRFTQDNLNFLLCFQSSYHQKLPENFENAMPNILVVLWSSLFQNWCPILVEERGYVENKGLCGNREVCAHAVKNLLSMLRNIILVDILRYWFVLVIDRSWCFSAASNRVNDDIQKVMTHKANIQLNPFLDLRDLLLLLCPQFQILLISSCLQSFNEPVLSVSTEATCCSDSPSHFNGS